MGDRHLDDLVRHQLRNRKTQAAEQHSSYEDGGRLKGDLVARALASLLRVLDAEHVASLPIYTLERLKTTGWTNREVAHVRSTGQRGYHLAVETGTFADQPDYGLVLSTVGSLYTLTYHRRTAHKVIGLTDGWGFFVERGVRTEVEWHRIAGVHGAKTLDPGRIAQIADETATKTGLWAARG